LIVGFAQHEKEGEKLCFSILGFRVGEAFLEFSFLGCKRHEESPRKGRKLKGMEGKEWRKACFAAIATQSQNKETLCIEGERMD